MAKSRSRNTKGRIVSAAWKLFYEQGYEETTIEDIISESGTSKGSFYHYFAGKDALLSSLSMIFDEKYEELMETLDFNMDSMELLKYLDISLLEMIDDKISMDLLARLLSSQLITRGEKHLLDRSRTYFRLLRKIVNNGQERGEITDTLSANDIINAYAMFERALLYDWCLSGGSYSLPMYAEQVMPRFLQGYKKTPEV